MTERPLTVNEAAEFLTVNAWQVREYVRRGLLPQQYITKNHLKRLVFRKQDLVDFINRNRGNK